MTTPFSERSRVPAWLPSASLENLRLRARLLKQIRDFFYVRKVMEVETPLLCHTSVTDPFIESIPALFQAHPQEKEQRYYLQTSPEYAMKRLLAAGCGSIYQISKAFRQGEIGRLHNPEFTLVEWYRLGFNHVQLMDEVDDLLQEVLLVPAAERVSYAYLFQAELDIDPHHASVNELKACAQTKLISVQGEITENDTWLDILFTHCIEPQLGKERPCFVYDFPISQAALARIREEQGLASRFEVYFHGMELANGFHELQDAREQRKRFEKNLAKRKQLGLASLPIDELLLTALQQGLPDCSGVALGVDRLLMLAAGSERIAEVLAFDFFRV